MEPLTGNIVTSEVDVFMYVVLTKAEKHVPYGKLVGTIECITLYNRVQLYLNKIFVRRYVLKEYE